MGSDNCHIGDLTDLGEGDAEYIKKCTIRSSGGKTAIQF